MAGFIAGEDRQQAVLFPDRLDDLVPADALVRVIDAFVAGLNLGELGFARARASGIGRPGYHPGDLLRLYVYGDMNGVRSSRALERACWTNLELAWLLRRLRPDFKTIADFRKDNGDGVAAACRAFVRFALDRGLIAGRVVALDGSRFAAASSARKRQQREQVAAEIAAHEAAIGRYLEELATADEATDPDEVEAEKARIRAAVEELQSEVGQKREALAATQARSLVVGEPPMAFGHRLFAGDAAAGWPRRGRRVRPTRQLAAELQRAAFATWGCGVPTAPQGDAELQIVLDAEAVANPSDSGRLAPGAAEVLAVQPLDGDGGEPAVTLLADAGYSSAKDAAVRGCGDPAPRSVACERLGLAVGVPAAACCRGVGRRSFR